MWGNFDKISDKRLALFISTAVLASILLILLPIVLFGIFRVTSHGETRYTQEEVFRVENILSNEMTRLDQNLLDWSPWDDTYQFALDQNQAYIDGNLSDASMINLNIDVFLTVNAADQVVFVKYVDPATQVETSLPFDVQKLLKAYPSLLKHADLQTGLKGIAFIPGYPMLIAARPILTSLKEGPAHGTLIWIQLLDEKKLENLSQLAQRKLAIFPINSLPEGKPTLPAPALLVNSVFVYPQNAETVLGYKYLNDLDGKPVLVMQVENPRDLYLQARTTAIFFSEALLVLGLLLFGGTYLFTRSFLKSRKMGRKYLLRFQNIVHQSSEAILLINRAGLILEANPASMELFGEALNQNQPSLLKSRLAFEPELEEALLRDISQTGRTSEHHCTCADGRTLEVELSASLIKEEAFETFSLVVRDITARKQAENAIKASEERYMLAANGANDGLWDWNLLNGTVYYSNRWKSMLGFDEDEVKPVPEAWFDRVHPEDQLTLRTELSDHLRNRTANFTSEYQILHKDGVYRWMLARGVAVWDPAGFASRLAGSQTDITERKNLEQQLRFDALHDALTGLGNRTLLIDHLCHVNERKKRRPELLFAVFFLDFDRFKQINDTLGHHAGDQLLIQASQRLDVGLRTSDTISRLSCPETLARVAGDEFVILLEDFQSIADVQKAAERLVKLLCRPYEIAGQEVTLTASIGMVIPEVAYEHAEDIIRDADIAMYRAKQLGGGQMVQFDQEMYQGTVARMLLESDLRKAVERHEFEVYFQPIYNLAGEIGNGTIVGFEALVRWNHPQRGLMLPDEFISIAEDIGMIVPMGYFVIEEACRQMVLWRNKFKTTPEVMISVNLSARQIVVPDLVETIRSILEKTGFDPYKLWLEVTESTLLENNELVISRMNELRALGIRIEIDDFGTGYSSLSYLQNLPVDGFKIDRSFIKNISEGGQQIVKTLVELGHILGLTEVAEGVETQQQQDYLRDLSCRYAQGYLMSRPVSASGIEDLLMEIKQQDQT